METMSVEDAVAVLASRGYRREALERLTVGEVIRLLNEAGITPDDVDGVL